MKKKDLVPVTLAFERADDKLSGLKVEWLTAEDDDVIVDIYAGAGCGNPYMDLKVKNKKTGEVRNYLADIRVLAKDIAKLKLFGGT